jgi:SAM-dependent methyltransferase
MAATAVEAWDERWATPEGRDDWLVPHPAVAALVPVLKARGTQHVLDLGCGVGRHALLFAEHGLPSRRSMVPLPASTSYAARRPRAASD